MTNRPNILYVGPLPGRRKVGGVGSTAARVLGGLASAGIQLRVIAHVGAGRNRPDRFAENYPEAEIVEYVAADDGLAKGSLERLRAHDERIASELRRMATALQPSAVLVGRPALAHGIVDVAAALGIPIVVNVPSIQRWVVDGVPRFAEDVTAALYACLRRADRVVAVADHVAADLADMGVRTVTTIPNGVDLQQFRPAPPDRSLQKSLHLGDDDIVVLHASNLKPMKHALDLVRSAAPALGRDRRLRYLIIGEGPDRAEMERTAHSLGIADHFRFVGQVEHLQIPDYVRLADLAIMPSVTEGMCISYLEAMACEKVLLASDIPGARELVDDGETGLLFPFGDIGAIADKTVALAADVEERQRIGKNGRTKVARDHVIETTVASYCGLIETVIENGPTRKLR